MGNTYGQILKSSSVIGGAQAVNLLIGLMRTKLVAVLLGPTGVGLIGLYQSATGLLGAFAGLGIGSSGVRQVAEAHGTGDQERMGHTVRVLRRVCWFTGLLGWALTAALSWLLSVWTFGNPNYALAIAVLGLTILLGNISDSQMALVQGVRRIGDLARLQVCSSIAGTIIAVGLYAWLGERGIVPVFLVSAAVNLGFSWWFARRIAVPAVEISWQQTFVEARGLVTLGLAFMLSGLLGAGVALATRAWILRGYGLEANGLYQAAWGISGVFAGFILQAMGMDFYPRLTAVANDHAEVNRLVNEQTEIGMLLALPGLLATLVFGPWIIRLLYSAKFVGAAELLPWFVLGVFGRVVSWPLGYIMLAKGAARWFAASEAIWACLHLLLIWFGLKWFGLTGVAFAFAVLYAACTVGMLWLANRLTQFCWSKSAIKILALSSIVVAAAFVIAKSLPVSIGASMGGVLVVLTGAVCFRQILRRLGSTHRLSRMVVAVPWIGPSLMD